MDEELKTYLVNLESRLGKRTAEVETRINEHTDERAHHLETRLLCTFSDASSKLEDGNQPRAAS